MSSHPRSVATLRLAYELVGLFVSGSILGYSRTDSPEHLLDILASPERDLG